MVDRRECNINYGSVLRSFPFNIRFLQNLASIFIFGLNKNSDLRKALVCSMWHKATVDCLGKVARS